LLKTPTGERLTSWLFTKHGKFGFGNNDTNPSSRTEMDWNLGPLEAG